MTLIPWTNCSSHMHVKVTYVNFSIVERLRSRVHAITTTWETGITVVKVPRASSLYLLVLFKVLSKIIPELNRKLSGKVFYILTSKVFIRNLSYAWRKLPNIVTPRNLWSKRESSKRHPCLYWGPGCFRWFLTATNTLPWLMLQLTLYQRIWL